MREPHNNIMEQMSHEIGNILQQISFMAETDSVEIDPSDALSKIKSKTKTISHLLGIYTNLIFEKSHEIETFKEVIGALQSVYSQKIEILGEPSVAISFLNVAAVYAAWILKNFNATIDLHEMSISITSENKQNHISYYVLEGNACNFAAIIRFLLGNRFDINLQNNKLVFSKINHLKQRLH